MESVVSLDPHTPLFRPAPHLGARIVAIGGGTGLPAVLEGLCMHREVSDEPTSDLLTAVVTVTDDGGSSGRLRRERGVLPPGDVRNCLAAFTDLESPYRRLLQHRFGDTAADAHPIGNLILAALTEITGDFTEAIDQLGRMIGQRGRVLPTTKEDVRLKAEFWSGQTIIGETSIVKEASAIRRLSLDPSPRPLPEVLRALVNADAIVVGPGSLYTSTLPNLLVEGIAATISGVNAVRIYVANLMTEPGETTNFSLDDHLRVIREHTGYDLFDYILVNRLPLPASLVASYASRGSLPVRQHGPLNWAGRAKVVEADFACETLLDRGKIRHEPTSLAAAIRRLMAMGRP